MTSLGFSFWNIHGYHSQYVGNKLCDDEFLSMLKGIDIIGLGELHAEGEVSIPGFINKKQKIREKKFKGPKIAGGIGVFVREEIDHLVQVVGNSNEDSIWVKINKENFDGKNDVYLGTYYVSPDNSKERNKKKYDFFSAVNEEVTYFRKKGLVLLQGDLNCRTGQEKDYVEHDKSDIELGIENFGNQILRNSEDKNKNPRGKELLDICKLNDLLILNGRMTGDIFGKYTSHNWNGSSVVDYCIASNEICDRIGIFSVGKYIPWLSDHCMISTTINVNGSSLKNKIEHMEPIDLHPGWVWNDMARYNFESNLSLPFYKERFEALENSDSLTPIELAKEIKILLLENIKTSAIREKKKIDESDKKSEPWFDSECKKKKNCISNLGNMIRKTPMDNALRLSLRTEKKSFRRIILLKKRNYKHKMLSLLESKRDSGTPKEFWNIFKKISPKNKKDSIQPSMKKFFDHFQNLSKSSRDQTVPSVSTCNGPLDYEIVFEELENSAKKMHLGKANGYDDSCNEMILGLVKTHPNVLLKLFNGILQSSEVIPDWALGMIVPLHKDGPKLDTSNYRGITLISCLGKFFLSVLNNRLIVFAKEHKLLSPAQLGFVAGNRCSDAHIIIRNLIKKKCHKENAKIFSCFVDFKKAFDSVPRDLLLKKILDMGITGKFFNILRHIYTTDQACVKLGQTRSTFFGLNIGVRQGCILSPLLFNLFISDLAKKFDAMEDKLQLGNTSVNSLFWADDLVLFSETKEGLDKLLKILELFCKENHLMINTKKTKCMIFNKTGRLMRRPFFLDGVKLEMVRAYKYLGFVITPSGEINTGLKDLRDRALKGFMKLKNDLGPSFNQDILVTLSLIDSLIKPILLYASDFWGCLKLPKNNPVENLHMMMCKQLLGVQKQTTNIGVLLELGRIPLSLFATKFAIKNWERIRLGQGNEILTASYKDCDLSWDSSIKSLLDSNGMLNFYMNESENSYPFVYKRIFKRLHDNFHQDCFEKIKDDTSKLRTYSMFKTEIGMAKYLTEIKNVTIRSHVTKFRLSNHRLAIETGRHDGTSKEERFCTFCPGKIENEYHFLYECSLLRHLRQRHLEPSIGGISGFEFFPINFKMNTLLSNVEYDTCKYIADGMDLRNFLASNPKPCD